VERKSRRGGSRALDEERHRFVLGEPMQRGRALRIWDLERRDAEHDLAGDAQRLAARRDDRELRRRTEERVRERGGRAQQVLAVVKDEQQRARYKEADHGVDLPAPERPDVERTSDRFADESCP
jgi:hypothetical protein